MKRLVVFRRHGKRPVIPCGSRGKKSSKANAKEEAQHPMSSLPHPSSDYALPPGLDTTEVPMDAHLDNKWRPVEEFVGFLLPSPVARTSRLLIFSSLPNSPSLRISHLFLHLCSCPITQNTFDHDPSSPLQIHVLRESSQSRDFPSLPEEEPKRHSSSLLRTTSPSLSPP